MLNHVIQQFCIKESLGFSFSFCRCSVLHLFVINLGNKLLEQITYIKFLLTMEKNATGIYKTLWEAYGKRTMSKAQVFLWVKCF
jgi:hypothetical protein